MVLAVAVGGVFNGKVHEPTHEHLRLKKNMATTLGPKVEGGRVRELKDGSGHPSQYIFCPACNTIHLFDDRWTFNNNFDRPTFNPSMLVHSHPTQPRCHSFVKNGFIQYLGDCTHDLKNQTIELPEITDDMW